MYFVAQKIEKYGYRLNDIFNHILKWFVEYKNYYANNNCFKSSDNYSWGEWVDTFAILQGAFTILRWIFFYIINCISSVLDAPNFYSHQIHIFFANSNILLYTVPIQGQGVSTLHKGLSWVISPKHNILYCYCNSFFLLSAAFRTQTAQLMYMPRKQRKE